MNLIEKFNLLEIPERSSNELFNTAIITGYPNCRIGVDWQGNAVLLFSVNDADRIREGKNFRLKYIEVVYNIGCIISAGGVDVPSKFTIVRFKTSDKSLLEYFLRISENLIVIFQKSPIVSVIVQAIERFVELFRHLEEVPLKSVQGFWGELLVIESSRDPVTLIDYWHIDNDQRFDFDASEEKVEVKTTAKFERIHMFSSEQLNPPEGCRVLIVSIFTRQASDGLSVEELYKKILYRIGHDFHAVEKLSSMINLTLGSSLEQSLRLKFDYDLAVKSKRFYQHHDVRKIDMVFIPREVSHVHYRSDLSSVSECSLFSVSEKSRLFSAL